MNKALSKFLLINIISAIVLIVLDQLSKYAALVYLKGKEAFVIIDGVFKLRYLENNGAAFSIMEGKQMFFIIITLVMLVVFFYIYIKLPNEKKYNFLRCICILLEAGAVGNLIDRIRFGYVIDFFYFELINFPTFNVADIYITVSMAILIFLIMFYYDEDDFSFLKRWEK